MKKLFSIFIVLLLVVSLSACSEDLQPKITELESRITELQNQVNNLESEKESLVTEKSSLISEKSDLEAQIKNLQDQIFDKVITISVEKLDGTLETNTIGVNDDYEGTLFDLLSASFKVTATVSEYGHYITGLEDLKPTNGAYISFAKNGESSMVGVDSAIFEDNDEFSFELVWWDTSAKSVSDGIDSFLNNQAATYVNATSIDYAVMAALSILGIEEDYVTDTEVQAYIDGLTITKTNEYFKAIVILEAAGLDATSLKSALKGIATPSVYGGTGYQLQAFNTNVTTVDYTAFEAVALADYAINTPTRAGVDSGSIGILALSNYTETIGVDTLITDWVTYIKENQTENGSIVDIDFGYGSNENAATMAQAIIGLVSAGVNPKGGDSTEIDMTKLNYDMVARLCEFQNIDGSFNWLMNDENPDLGFSTPQAFLALTVYYQYSNSYNTAVNAYDFK
jgi:regulator of replication initiation timing